MTRPSDQATRQRAAPGEGSCVALNGCKGAKALHLGKAMLQGSYAQVGWGSILKACCSWALPAQTIHTPSHLLQDLEFVKSHTWDV